MNSSKQIKLGALMSYFTIAFNMISGLIYTPWMITQIGQSNYGLYTLATSLITLFIMDFGMSAAVSRFVSKYRAEGNQQAVNDFLGIIYKLYFLIAGIFLCILIGVSFFIESIYDNLSASELETFKVLYVIVGTFSVVSFPFTNLNGILNAYEKFTEQKLADLFHKAFIVATMVVALMMGYGVYALVTVNAISGLLTIAIKLIIIRRKTQVKTNFKYFNKGLLKDIFSFSAWTTISSLAQRLIFNITPTIITAVSTTGTIGVAVFGLAQTIEGYVYTFATAINGMFMPRISKYVYEDKKDSCLMELMIKVGRIQCMIIGAIIAGFIAFGESFIIHIWNKPDFAESYLCAVLLIIPSYMYLPMEIANTTMIVENKVKLKSFVTLSTGILNVILSLMLSRELGALGASLSILISYLFSTIISAVIYKKVLRLDMWSFFKETFLKITPPLLLVLFVGICLEQFNPMTNNFVRFLVNGVVYVMIFAIFFVLFVMNGYEKDLVFGIIKKVLRKFRLVK